MKHIADVSSKCFLHPKLQGLTQLRKYDYYYRIYIDDDDYERQDVLSLKNEHIPLSSFLLRKTVQRALSAFSIINKLVYVYCTCIIYIYYIDRLPKRI